MQKHIIPAALGAGAAAGTALLYYSAKIEPEQLVITRPRLPQPPPCRIVFFSDLHVGRKYSPAHLPHIVDTIIALAPQLTLFGGDFFARLSKDLPILDFDALAAQLARIPGPKLAVLGNHDLRDGAKPYFYRLFNAAGFTVLWDEVASPLPGVSVCGLSAYSHGAAMAKLPAGGYRICLCHMPDKARWLPLSRCDLMLSGHSHNSQVQLPVLSRLILPPGGKFYPYGLYRPQGEAAAPLFVSRGIGMSGPPLRLGCPPELVVLE